MRVIRFLVLLTLIVTVSGFACAQQVPSSEEKDAGPVMSEEEKAKVKKTEELALKMLEETAAEIDTLRTPENRIGLAANLVELLWIYDPDGARQMFRVLSNSFTQLFTEYSNRLNVVGVTEGQPNFLAASDTRKAMARMEKALAVREALARSAAGRDPVTALEFARSTSNAVAAGEFAERLEQADNRIQVLIVEQFAAVDLEIAKDVGAVLLRDRLTDAVIAHLRLVRSKNDRQGAEFASDVFSAASKDLARAKPNFDAQAALLRYATGEFANSKEDGARVQLISRGDVRFQAEAFGREVLRSAEMNEEVASAYADAIEEYSPTTAERIRKKFSKSDESKSSETVRLEKLLAEAQMKDASRNAPPPPAVPEISAEGSDDSGASEEESDPNSELLGILTAKDGGAATEEERQAMADKARAAAASQPMVAAKIGILTAVATKLKELGDSGRAGELVSEAEGLVTNQPKNYQEFMENWMLAGGIVRAAPEKSFSILENAIFRINDVINAGVTIAEFIDVNNEIVQDGELLVGAFAGGMTMSITRSLAGSDNLLFDLAQADFDRTKALTDRFDKPEIRIMAKTLLLGVVLGDRTGSEKNGMESFLLGL
jgi:hypothetical protein